ncbi:MAG: type 1 glutamine amidotransferase [Acidobacteria bacterium]|nr:type 1 glutamine amidotransferase [Acidobacteriota bacterium]
MRILAVQNCALEGFGRYAQHLEHRGHQVTVLPAWGQSRWPNPKTYDAILVGGTPISAWQAEEVPFLRRELTFLADALTTRRPCFGICCGAQFLVRLLGAEVRRAARMEIGIQTVSLTDEGQNDPLFADFPPEFPVFQWHGDVFDIPAGGRWLVQGDECPYQAFRRGNVAGLLFHLEIGPAEAAAWTVQYADELGRHGGSFEELIHECRKHVATMFRLADRLMDNFLRLAASG